MLPKNRLDGLYNKDHLTNKISPNVPNIAYCDVVIFMIGKDKHTPDFSTSPWSTHVYPQIGIWHM